MKGINGHPDDRRLSVCRRAFVRLALHAADEARGYAARQPINIWVQ